MDGIKLLLFFLFMVFFFAYVLLALVVHLPNRESSKTFLPHGHSNKQHISRSGGLVVGILGIILGFFDHLPFFYSGMVAFTIGLIDDRLKKNKGLSNKVRLIVWFILGFYIAIDKYIHSGALIYVPFIGLINMGLWYIPFVMFFVVAVINGVNMTDGLDGLVTVPVIFNFIFFIIISLKQQFLLFGYYTFMLPILLAFLMFNKHPAKIFLGDSGSIFLGTIIAHSYVTLSCEFLMPIVGFVFTINVLCSALQIFSIRIFKKKVFKMAPLHHHFELCTYKEKHIVMGFWLLSLITFILGVVIKKYYYFI